MGIYYMWKKKDLTTQEISISFMNDDLVYEYEQYKTVHVIWMILKEKFGRTTISKLR